jgi:hypothetical protein
MDQLERPSAKVGDLPGQDHPLPPLERRGEIGLVEEHRGEIAGRVVEENLDGLAAGAWRRWTHPDDRPGAGLDLPDPEITEGGETAPVLIATGDKDQGVRDGL